MPSTLQACLRVLAASCVLSAAPLVSAQLPDAAAPDAAPDPRGVDPELRAGDGEPAATSGAEGAGSGQVVTSPLAALPQEPAAAPQPVSAAAGQSAAPSTRAAHDGRFAFGSYGRIRAASDLRGKTGRSSNIVAFGQRNDLDNYVELEFRREDSIDELELRVVATLALAGDFFHYDGQFDENLAIRNLYAEADDLFVRGLALWAGSRMARGDDVYLLNFWPLDNLNLVGGGARLARERYELALHAGLTRPENPFFKQTIQVVPALGFTAAPYDLLDRPRSVLAAKGTWFPLGRLATALKAVVYGEYHDLPSGEREAENDIVEKLPREQGYVLGAQLGYWTERPRSFVNLFVRYASGIAVYDPLATPMQVGSVARAGGASEWRVALSGNLEHGMLGLQVGGYMRGFRDEASTVLDGARLLEGAIDARPYLWFGKYAGLSVDAGYQALAVSKLDDRTGEQVRGGITTLAAIPFISPYGRGTYTRPHIHLIYQLSLRDEGARALYPERDPRSSRATEHFLAIGAEWWFNSTSY